MNDHYYEEPNCFEEQFGIKEQHSDLGMSVVYPPSGLHHEPTKEEKDEILRHLQETA